MTHQYGMQFRPPCLGTVPRGLQFDLIDADSDLIQPYARHGIMVPVRQLTPKECRDFELVPILRTDAELTPVADYIASELAEHAAAYLRKPARLAEAVQRYARLSPDGVRQCIADPARLLALVTNQLESAA